MRTVTLRGGYNVPAAGAPASEIGELPAPVRLCVPLASARFSFSELRVEEGQKVAAGDILAVDPGRFSIPLLAPYGGTVKLDEAEGHVVLDDLTTSGGGVPSFSDREPSPRKLLSLGAWQHVADASSGAPADPDVEPVAVIVSTVRMEPFVAGGEAYLPGNLYGFVRGLEHIAALAPNAALYVIVPDVDEPLAAELNQTLSGVERWHTVSVPLRYPFDDPALLARRMGLLAGNGERAWAVSVQGVLAIDAVLTDGRPRLERVVSLAGPAVDEPAYFSAVAGYPIADILEGRLGAEAVRVVNGGLLTGRDLPPGQLGLDVECDGLTVLAELSERKMLAFARPGLTSRSYNRSFVGTARTDFAVPYTTGLSGETRPCIACGQCADVCPAEIFPHVIHKHLYARRIEEAQRTRVDLCIGCGLCSYVCPSKIDLRHELLDAKWVLEEEARLVAQEQAERETREQAEREAQEQAEREAQEQAEGMAHGQDARENAAAGGIEENEA